jgi:hypothetical protein
MTEALKTVHALSNEALRDILSPTSYSRLIKEQEFSARMTLILVLEVERRRNNEQWEELDVA